MALATTCPQCKTSFKVVPDQLKLRRGMVRCGMCQNVFSGIDYLRYVDEGPKAAAPQPGTASVDKQGANTPSTGGTAAPSAAGKSAAPPPTMSDTTGSPPQTDLKTAFFLPETIFHPTTRIDMPEPKRGPVTVMLPSSLRRESVEDKPAAAPPVDNLPTPSTAPAVSVAPVASVAPTAPAAPSAHDLAPPYSLRPSEEQDALVPPLDASSDITSAILSGLDESLHSPLDQDIFGDDPTQLLTPTLTADIAALDQLDEARNTQSIDASDDHASVFDLGFKAGVDGRDSHPKATSRSARRRSKKKPVVEAVDEGLLGSNALAQSPSVSDDAIDYFSSSDQSRRGFSSRLLPLGWVASVVLALALLLQVGIGARNWVARSWPQTQAGLGSMLAPLSLKVAAPRDLSSLTIESFELQASSNPGVLMMSALLRNRAGYGVQWPALELSLTDGAGSLLVRKVIMPDDYLKNAPEDPIRADPKSIGSKAELPLKLAFEARDLVPSGFSVNLFYP